MQFRVPLVAFAFILTIAACSRRDPVAPNANAAAAVLPVPANDTAPSPTGGTWSRVIRRYGQDSSGGVGVGRDGIAPAARGNGQDERESDQRHAELHASPTRLRALRIRLVAIRREAGHRPLSLRREFGVAEEPLVSLESVERDA